MKPALIDFNTAKGEEVGGILSELDELGWWRPSQQPHCCRTGDWQGLGVLILELVSVLSQDCGGENGQRVGLGGLLEQESLEHLSRGSQFTVWFAF